jgi:ribosomal protein S18 acetylase RimI-like enzyme
MGGVRPAASRDLEAVADLWRALIDQHAALDPSFSARPGAEEALRKLLAAQLVDPGAALFVFEEGGELVGFCSVRVERAPSLATETGRAEIGEIGVREGSRRRGVGRALVEAAERWIGQRGVRRVEVRVASANAEGQGFWRALGFGDLMDVLQRRL